MQNPTCASTAYGRMRVLFLFCNLAHSLALWGDASRLETLRVALFGATQRDSGSNYTEPRSLRRPAVSKPTQVATVTLKRSLGRPTLFEETGHAPWGDGLTLFEETGHALWGDDKHRFFPLNY